MNRSQRFIMIAATWTTVALIGTQPALATDVDVFLSPPPVTRDDKPNVLIIFGNSASLDHNTMASLPVFNPTTTYTGDYDNDKIYWCSGSAAETCAALPTSSTTQKFADTALVNRCQSARNYSGTTPATKGPLYKNGRYTDTIVKWVPTDSTYGKWARLPLGSMQPDETNHIECDDDNQFPKIEGNKDHATNTVPGDERYDQRYTNSGNASAQLNWSDPSFELTTLFTGNYLNYRTSILGVVLESRLTVAKESVKTMIDTVRGVNLGLMVFNSNWDGSVLTNGPQGGRVVMKIAPMDDARRLTMSNLIDSLSGHPGDTDWLTLAPHLGSIAAPVNLALDTYANQPAPLAETFWEAMQYAGGKPVDYGDDETFAPLADTEAFDATTGNYDSPFTTECQQIYVIYVTDGVFADNSDDDANSKFASLSAVPLDGGEAPQTISGSALDEMARYAFNNDLNDDIGGTQRAITYTVGVGVSNGSPQEALLQATAQAGHGIYTPANSTEQLGDALRATVTNIRAITRSFAAPTLSVNAFNKIFNRDEVYFAVFSPTSRTRWNGNLKKYRLCNADDVTNIGCEFGEVLDANNAPAIDPVTLRIKDTARSFWSSTTDGGEVTRGGAGSVVPVPNARRFYSNTTAFTALAYNDSVPGMASGKGESLANHLVNPESTTNPFMVAVIANPALLGLPVNATSDEVRNLVRWIIGWDIYDEDGDGNGFAEGDRRWPFSDPLHSRPVAINYGFEPDANGDPDPTKPIIKLFVGTNDGVLRMVNDYIGVEEWAYLPRNLLSIQATLAQNPEASKIYGIDGTPSFRVVDNNDDGIIDPGAGDFVHMYVSMRRGGKSIYAFDVTPSATLTSRTNVTGITPKLLWYIQGGPGGTSGFERLAQTWSRPQIANILYCNDNNGCSDPSADVLKNIGKTMLLFGGGYDTNQDNTIFNANGTGTDASGNAVFVVDPTVRDNSTKAPDRLLFVGGPDNDGNSNNDPQLAPDKMRYSIPMDLALLDSDRNGYIDRVYFADTAGQVWRLDFSSQFFKNVPRRTYAGVMADFGCALGDPSTDRPLCADANFDDFGGDPSANITSVQHRRKFMHQVDVAQVRDDTFSINAIYDVVVLASGDRADPTDKFTEGHQSSVDADGDGILDPAPVQAVHNRIYALRDYLVQEVANASNFPKCVITQNDGSQSLGACPSGVITEAQLYQATSNALQDPEDSGFDAAVDAARAKTGWYIDLKEPTAQTTAEGLTTNWVGEKGLATPVIFDDIIFQTTYVPASDVTAQVTCSKTEGEARLYALNLLTAASAIDFDESGSLETSDRYTTVGGGIPSELVVVIREGGVTGLVGVSGGTATPNIGGGQSPVGRTYWWQGKKPGSP